MDKEKFFKIAFFLYIIVLCFFLGWFGREIYNSMDEKNRINGLWLSGYANKSETLKRAYELEPYGSWVCTNIHREMTFEECVRVSRHECGHELFAKLMEKHNDSISDEFEQLLYEYGELE